MFSIEAIMSTDLITLPPTATLAEARTLMHTNRIHHLPIVEGNVLVGLVTLTTVMVTDIATIDEHASLRQAALFIEKHQIGCLPIVTDGILRGIITDTDFVGVAINLLELTEETEPVEQEYA